MADRYAKVKIGSKWLTSDGAESSPESRCEVTNESAFASAYTASSEQALDFTVHSQIVNRGVRGIPFTVRAPYASEAVLAAIVADLTSALGSLASVRVISQSLNPFDVQAMPVPTDGGALYSFESRSGGIARGVTFSFISTGAGGD
jgi:hypothetical protein